MGSNFAEQSETFFRPSVAALTPTSPASRSRTCSGSSGSSASSSSPRTRARSGRSRRPPTALEARRCATSTATRTAAPTRCTRRSPSATASRARRSASARAPTAASTCSSQAILDPGDEVVCGWPSFPSYVIYARKQGASAVTVPLREHRYDLGALIDAVDAARTKLVYICHPNNPTGTMNSTDELDEYFARCPRSRADGRSTRRTSSTSTVPTTRTRVERYLKAGRRVVVLRTFSKIYGLAGLRVGYAVGSRRRCARRLRRCGGRSTSRRLRRSPRSRASATRPSWRAGAQSTPRGSRGSRRSCARTASSPSRRSATSSSSRPGETRTRSSSGCCAKV